MSGKKNFSTKFPLETHDALDRISKAKGLAKSELVHRLIDHFLETYDKVPEGHGAVATAPVTQVVPIEAEGDDLTERQIWINACTEIVKNADKGWNKSFVFNIRKMFKDGKPVAYGQKLAVNKAYYSLFKKNVECFVFEKEEEQQQPEQQPEKQLQPQTVPDMPTVGLVLSACRRTLKYTNIDGDFLKLVEELRGMGPFDQISVEQAKTVKKYVFQMPVSAIAYFLDWRRINMRADFMHIYEEINSSGFDFDANDDLRKIRNAYRYYVLYKQADGPPEDWNIGSEIANLVHVKRCLWYIYHNVVSKSVLHYVI